MKHLPMMTAACVVGLLATGLAHAGPRVVRYSDKAPADLQGCIVGELAPLGEPGIRRERDRVVLEFVAAASPVKIVINQLPEVTGRPLPKSGIPGRQQSGGRRSIELWGVGPAGAIARRGVYRCI